jgi:hypothetical protein
MAACVICSGTLTNLHSQVCPSCSREEGVMRSTYERGRAAAPDLLAVMSTAEAELRLAAQVNRNDAFKCQNAIRSMRAQKKALEDAQRGWAFLRFLSSGQKAKRRKKSELNDRIAADEAQLAQTDEFKRRVAQQIMELER